jgi:hypothetical protein
MPWTLIVGEVVSRKELHELYGGRRQGGISPSRKTPDVFLFSDPSAGRVHGYIYDGPDTDDPTLFHYTGEGQTGNQRMVSGNKAVRDHVAQGRTLRLFKGVRGEVRYLGEYQLDDRAYDLRQAPSTGGGPYREVIVFRLRPVGVAARPAPLPKSADYRRAKPAPTTPSDPFTRDPNAVDRALQAHADTQNALNDFLVAKGARTWSPGAPDPDFDLAWRLGKFTFVGEVKSLLKSNEDRQLRLGLGQVLDYQELMAARYPGVRAVLAVEVQPQDPRWLRLCERHGVILVWPGSFDALAEPKLTAPI